MYGSRHVLDSGSDRRQRASRKSWSLFGRSRQVTASAFLLSSGMVMMQESELL